MACFDFLSASPPKVEKADPAPTPNDPAVGGAELKRKRAAAASFGRKSTIATSGMGVQQQGTPVTTTGVPS